MSDASPQGYRHPGDVELLNVSFIDLMGQVNDITTIASQISIYQNIFNHYLECDIIIEDAERFLHQLPVYRDLNVTGGFSGNEIVVISYQNRAKIDQKVYTHLFRLYKISDRKLIDRSDNEGYLFSGISEESYNTFTLDVCKSLGNGGGNTVKKMIEGVYKQYLANGFIKETYRSVRNVTHNRIDKQLIADETVGLHQFVIPGWTVDDTIRFLCREADSPNKTPYFVFYEDSENFNFRNVSELVASEPVESFEYTSQNVTTDDSNNIIISYKVNRQFDFLKNVDRGLYKSKTIHIDMLKKRTDDTIYDYSVSGEKFNKLQSNLIAGVVYKGNPITTLTTTRTGHDACCPLFEPENHLPKRIDRVKDIRTGYMRSVFNTAIEVAIPANPHMKVGQVIELHFPLKLLNQSDGQVDKYLSGKYLITKVRQIFSTTEIVTVLECTKDGGL